MIISFAEISFLSFDIKNSMLMHTVKVNIVNRVKNTQHISTCFLKSLYLKTISDLVFIVFDFNTEKFYCQDILKNFYKISIPKDWHRAMFSLSQYEACTSPICALPKSSIHNLLCPMPPPIERGKTSSKIAL